MPAVPCLLRAFGGVRCGNALGSSRVTRSPPFPLPAVRARRNVSAIRLALGC
jgi:hypothetical protein